MIRNICFGVLALAAAASAFRVCSLVESNGYPCEEHRVRTRDGYLLLMQRIPVRANETRGVVIYQHGLADCSAGASMNKAHEALPYILSANGYDVWLGNNRGNGQSMEHANFPTKSDDFWAFSFDHMGKHDLPAQIDYVLNATGRANLTWIGHSQGTIQGFLGFQDHAVAAKVNLFIALAPVVYVKNCRSALVQLLANLGVDQIIKLFGMREFAVPAFIDQLLPGVCTIGRPLCKAVLDMIMGPTKHIDTARLPYYTQYFPSPTSVQNMVHWAQSMRTGRWQMYDYGTPSANMRHYNQTTPPAYDLGLLPPTLKIALFSGTNDYLSDPKDVKRLASELPPASLVYNKVVDTYAHADFILADDANRLLYPDVLLLLRAYTW